MKYSKIFALSLGVLLMASCSDENNNFNTDADVKVEMADSQITIMESEGEFSLPIKVEGKANGTVRVTVKVEGTGNNPAEPFEDRNGEWTGNYILTSATINISDDQNEGLLEFNIVDDFTTNANRSFTVTIVSAEGAKVGTVNSTLVTIEDNDAVPYERIQGKYRMSCIDDNGDTRVANVSIKGVSKTSPDYGEVLNVTGLTATLPSGWADEGSSMEAIFQVDPETNEPVIYLLMPQDIGKFTHTNYASLNPRIWALYGMSTAQGLIPGVLSEDGRTITFPEDNMMVFYAATDDFSQQIGTLGYISILNFTR